MLCDSIRRYILTQSNILLSWPPSHNYSVGETYSQGSHGSDNSDAESDAGSDRGSETGSGSGSEKEFINKEAPEGIEVAEIDGLHISETLGE